ncbi:aminoglycoside phosphotransferase family protein [Gryllotalpicola koreensis]|uniref:Aminoglycoside phosphotransferase domain-containing protein n=1 Tax=Gryllotalpicola koreensis TaxID=993086 RepID=A0ABP8A4W7_9MICO
MDIPHADLTVDKDLAERLVRAQFPALAGPVALVAQGWDNALFRLGDAWAIRMPRREVAAHLVEHEQQWLPVLQQLVDLPLPVPVGVGRPGPEYPFAWSIIPWADGVGGAELAPTERDRYARQFAEFFAALHVPAPADAPHNPVRGVRLATRSVAVHARLDGLVGRLDTDELAQLRTIWDTGAAAAAYDGPAVWLHGDPHPGNVVIGASGLLATVVDFGDVTSGDPATDLSAAWLHFTPAGRAEFRARYTEHRQTDAASWARARAWAVSIGTAAFAASDGTGLMARMGREAIEQVLSG